MKARIDPVVIAHTKRLYFAAKGRAAKKAVVETAARHFGLSYSSMSRKLELNQRHRKLSSTQQEDVEEKNKLARAVWEFQQMKTKDDKRCTIRAAHRFLQATGQVPGWFTEKMCYDAIDRQHLQNLAVQTYKRFEFDAPHDCYQADFTKSNFLKYIGNNTVLVTDGRWSRGEDDLYVWIGGCIDDRSRVVYYEYLLTPGENATITQQFLVSAMSEKPGMMLLQGKPSMLYVDRGPGFEAASTEAGLKRLGITHIAGADFKDHNGHALGITNKQARGKIEAFNRFVKSDFEQHLHLHYGPGYKMTLADVNRLLHEWCEWQNQQEHPEHADEGKWNAFSAALSECEYATTQDLALFGLTFMVKVSRRLIRVAKNEYYHSPAFIGEGEEVEVIKRQNECYVLYRGSEIKLVPQASPYGPNATRSAHPRKVSRKQLISTLSAPASSYEGIDLKERFDEELREITKRELTLAGLPDEEKRDLKFFFAEPRSIDEIKAKADDVKLRIYLPIKHSKVILHSNEMERVQ